MVSETSLNEQRVAAPKPFRLALAQALLRNLPPLFSPRLRSYVYPYRRAAADDYTFQVVSQAGVEFRGSTADPHAYSLSIHGYYDWRNLAVAAAVCREGDTVIEVGANVGTETVGFAGLVGPRGKVIAFEPLPSNIANLDTILALNGGLNVVLFPVAVGHACTMLRFCAPEGKANSGLGHVADAADTYSPNQIEVECLTLDSLAGRLGRARLLAIDVEGSEVSVILGAQTYIRENRPVLIVEAAGTHQRRAGFALSDFHRILVHMGYQIRSIGKLGLGPVDLSDCAAGTNWLCVHEREQNTFRRVMSTIRYAGLLPALAGINPICRRRSTRG
jgi:FkbM family methyltransferase